MLTFFITTPVTNLKNMNQHTLYIDTDTITCM